MTRRDKIRTGSPDTARSAPPAFGRQEPPQARIPLPNYDDLLFPDMLD